MQEWLFFISDLKIWGTENVQWLVLKTERKRHFPGGPAVRTLYWLGRGLGSTSSQELSSHMRCGVTKRLKKKLNRRK